ncbi:diacylglycerol/lipid kinase family protein [Hirschia litorea]|uniref:Diacylglycerol/lipid kinase family protein n=2 Tax=Hirschia litorea TaxID=1199156 RepID=A0ABW2IP60_9PROT
MTMYAIVNMLAKTVPDDAKAQLGAFLEERNIQHEILCVEPDDLCNMFEDINQRTTATQAMPCIVWGGDGTIACALENLSPKKFSIIALPGGTMNLLHRTIHGEGADWQTILDNCLVANESVNISRGCLQKKDGEDLHFYVATLLGKLAQLAIPREELRENNLISAVSEMVATDDVLDLDPILEIQLSNGKSYQASAIGVGVDKSIPHAFDIGMINPDSILDLASIGLQSFIGDWHDVDEIDRFRVPYLTVISDESNEIDATLDGEFQKLSLPIDIVFEPAAVKVVSAKL